MRRTLVVSLALVPLFAGSPQSADAPSPLARFLTREELPLRSYRAERRLHASNSRFHAEATIVAVTELAESGAFRYDVTSERGSSTIRERVLKAVLRDEAALWQRGDPARLALTGENYRFDWDGTADGPETRIRITPFRKDALLVVGAMFLAHSDGDLLRIEGRLAKNPSFWTNRVEVTRRYARLAGVRVPIATESIAHVRLAGRSEFSMTYEYESINGQPVPTPTEP